MSFEIRAPKELIVMATLTQIRTYCCLRSLQYRRGAAVQDTLADIGEALRRPDGRPLLRKARVSEGLQWLVEQGYAVFDMAEQGYRCTEPTGYGQLVDSFDPARRYDADTGRRLLRRAVQGEDEVFRIPKQSVSDSETTPINTIKRNKRIVSDSETGAGGDPDRRARLIGKLASTGVYADLAVRLTSEYGLDWIDRCLAVVLRLKARGELPHAGALLVKLIRGEEDVEALEAIPSSRPKAPATSTSTTSQEPNPYEGDRSDIDEQIASRNDALSNILKKYVK